MAGTSFVRRPGSDNAYLLSSNFTVHLTRGLSDWRDRRVVIVDTSQVSRVDVRTADDAFTLVRQDTTWTISEGGEADELAIRGVLEELAVLRANGFLEEGDELYGTPSEIAVTALSAEGDTLAALTLGEGEGDRWIMTRGNDTRFRLPSFRVDRLAPSRERLTGN